MGGIRLSAALAVLTAASFVFGQATEQRAGTISDVPPLAAPTKPSGASKSKPAAEMGKLKFLLGRWSTVEKFEPNESAPSGGSGLGRAIIQTGPGSLSLIENYGSKNNSIGPFGGHAVIWWDAKAGVYKSFWCDSMNACTDSFGIGQWEGANLVFRSESEYQGRKMAMREIFSNIAPDSFTWTEEVSTDGGPAKLFITIQYTRLTGGAAKPTPAPAPKM
jgi:hypothetical protein